MPATAEKLSVTIPAELAKRVRRRLGKRPLSTFVATAMEHEIEREELGSFLRGLDAELGPVPPDVVAEVRSAWRKR